MDTFISVLLLGLMLLSLAYIATFWFRAMRSFDDLIKYEYENLHEQWIAEGEPRGMFWKPPQRSNNILNLLVRSNPGLKILKWTFFAPQWVKSNADAESTLKRARKYMLCWNIAVPLWFSLFFGLIYLYALISK